MLKILLQWATSYLIALGFSVIQHCTHNNYLSNYLLSNIISIQLSVISINLATLGIVAAKLADLIDKGLPSNAFEKSVKQMKASIYEQVGLIAAASLFGVLSNIATNERYFIIGNAIIIGLLVQHVRILIDTGNSVFIALIASATISKSSN